MFHTSLHMVTAHSMGLVERSESTPFNTCALFLNKLVSPLSLQMKGKLTLFQFIWSLVRSIASPESTVGSSDSEASSGLWNLVHSLNMKEQLFGATIVMVCDRFLFNKLYEPLPRSPVNKTADRKSCHYPSWRYIYENISATLNSFRHGRDKMTSRCTLDKAAGRPHNMPGQEMSFHQDLWKATFTKWLHATWLWSYL